MISEGVRKTREAWQSLGIEDEELIETLAPDVADVGLYPLPGDVLASDYLLHFLLGNEGKTKETAVDTDSVAELAAIRSRTAEKKDFREGQKRIMSVCLREPGHGQG